MKSDSWLVAMTRAQKLQHFRDGIFNAIAHAAKEGPGQPPMVDRFRTASNMVDSFEANGVPFGVCENSKMNKKLRKFLNAAADLSPDRRKSRCKKITAGAVRALLLQVRRINTLGNHFITLPPYVE